MSSETPKKYSADEWEHLRERFSKSILKETEISELGKSVGISWPFKGSGETPEKYIQFNLEELQSVPGLINKKKRIKDLMDVLREILAFDDPFSEMTDTVEKKNYEDRIYGRVLAKLEIPEDYPANLIPFSTATRDLLHNNNVKTLLETIYFGKKSASKEDNYVDLQTFISGLALANETTIKKYLPFRIGQRGLHLPEAIGLLVRDLDKPIQVELLYYSGATLTESEASIRDENGAQKSLESALKIVSLNFNEICKWFDAQVTELKKLCSSPESVERYFLAINNAEIERVAIALVMLHFDTSEKSESSLFKKVTGLFKR